ncbi:archaeosortase/exosortase family protein [Candidatus Woesearchaeota archaeon]|nr:archaeosortase/exosortase family protein [Candidatus Woesearchaeota archaeon]
MKKKKKKLIDKGVLQFVIRTAIFLAVIFGLNFFVFLYFRHTAFFLKYLKLSSDFYFDFMSGLRGRDFLNSVLFVLTLFIIWNRAVILKFRQYKQDKKQTVVFAVIAVLLQVAHYFFKYLLKTNSEFALSHTLIFTLAKYGFNISFVIALAVAVYNFSFIKTQFNKFKKQIPVFAVIFLFYYFLIQFFQGIWRFLGNFVANSVYFILSLTFKNTYLKMDAISAPRLGVNNFIVGISKECSGIDSLLLFLSLFSVIFVLDWKRLNKKRMLTLLIPGIIGTVAYNLFRVYVLLLVGVFISPEFAVDMFHSNIGWILFLVFFIIFWHFGSSWVYEKKKK